MAVNLSEALAKMRQAGPRGIKMLPMPGQDINTGMYRIDISIGGPGQWECILEGVPKATAESLVNQAIASRVIME